MSAASPVPAAWESPARHNNFGLLRLLLAVAVVFSHGFSVATGRVEDEPLAASTGLTLGSHAVNAFFRTLPLSTPRYWAASDLP